ncbi:MAG: DUF177 domain-containing protein [Endomicrobiaceae bacterium]|nr:DUF177 domain-containing protein [Endomicrobiaceae bacterium]
MEKFILCFDDFKKKKTLEVKNEVFNLDLDSSILKKSDLKVSFKAVKYSDIINIVGTVSGVETFECSRCLVVFDKNTKVDFEFSFAKEDGEFNLFDEIKQTIILDIPMQPLCCAGCKGICQVCGCNKNQKDCSCKEQLNSEFIFEKWSKIIKLNKK